MLEYLEIEICKSVYVVASYRVRSGRLILGPPVPNSSQARQQAALALYEHTVGRNSAAFERFAAGLDRVDARSAWYEMSCYLQKVIESGLPVSADDQPRILYDERIIDSGGQPVIVRLRSDGMMLLGRSEDRLRQVVFYNDPRTGLAWVPERTVFVSIMTEALAHDEYDLDGEVACLESFLLKLRDSLKSNQNGATPTDSSS